jgi:transketolase
MAYYAVLAAKGFISEAWLPNFARFDSPLGMHPDHLLIPGVEASSGSLGHGLPLSLGMSVALRAQGNSARVFCLLGDAELDEGTNAEAIAVAARLRLDALTAVVVDNQSSSLGWPGGIASRFAGEGWSTATVDGRDHEAIYHALIARDEAKPRAVVCVVEAKS